MKKTFPLVSERHQPARLVEQIKGEVKKYLKRERRKKLPEGNDYWDFDCRAGESASESTALHVKELGSAIERAASEGKDSVYLEVIARPVRRGGRGHSE